MNVQSRAHRILRLLDSYAPIGSDDARPEGLPPLGAGESWVGVYMNGPGDLDDALAFSSDRLHVRGPAGWGSVAYAEIEGARVAGGKEDARVVVVETASRALSAPVRGGRGRLRDSFEVLRFLNRVAEDRRPSSGRPTSRSGRAPADRVGVSGGG